ncbi:MAG TPA: serine/threonine-protein kinase [Gemmatimonadales bacterium]|jgi:serine/threonine-protein kinase|nr:serine/threonine-protein kinase [Gemmatimonadales bacterium]
MAELSDRLQAALGAAYRIEKELGGGGMSRVFVAEETRLARRVVIKVLPPELAAEISVDRFNREIQLSASLQHPHIVPLLTAGGSADVLYYTMPLVEGEALRIRLAREGELPVRDAVRILKDVADALAYAHARGIVHRDIKPDNVLLSGGHAVVADFGVAKAVSQAKGQSGLTSVGVALGTPTYMAPEQAAGDPDIDHRADIYALGAMAYEMLTGRPPFTSLSPHQMLAAHITEPVEPITDRRPALPPALADLVMRCLEKNPPDRPQSAAEIQQLLEALATPSGSLAITSGAGATLRHVLRRPRNWWIGGGVLAAALLGGGWWALHSPRAVALDENRLAVAPFDVLGAADLALWREGLVDVLSRSLDGAGPLRTVSPTLIVKRWSGRADPASAQALGRETGAGTVVYGQLLAAGPDSVRLTATVLDVRSGERRDIERREASARLDRLADSLTVAVLRELGRTRAIGSVRSASLGSRSLPALKAFLQGEQFLRRSEWDSALMFYQRAIGLDSGFTLAWSHAGLAAGWQHRTEEDSTYRVYRLVAGGLNHGLAPRDSFAVLSESLTAVVWAGPQRLAGRWWTYGRRVVATLDEAVRRYPDDPELWYMLGDARHHFGGLAGVPARAALDAFDRAIALDSAFTPSYVHAVGLALERDGPAGARRYGEAFLAAGAVGRSAQDTRLILDLLDPNTRAGAMARIVDSSPPEILMGVWRETNRWMDSAEVLVQLLRAAAARESAQGKQATYAVFALPAALATRGHLREAYGNASPVPLIVAQLILLGAVPPDSAGRLAAAWVSQPGQGAIFAAPLLAARRDTTALLGMVRTMDRRQQRPLPPQAPPVARDFIAYLAAVTRAYLTLARGDTAAALRQFDAVPDSACYGACSIDELVHAQLMAARGRHAEAAVLLDRPQVGFLPLLPLDMLRALERGRVNERLGNRERAIAGYTLVVEAWRHADPELKAYVDEARAALARLSAGR